MRKWFLIIMLVFVFCLSGCSVFPKDYLGSAYTFVENEEYTINSDTNIGFKTITYKNINTHILSYLNENLEVSEEEGTVKSLKVGKNCISITGSLLSIERRITNKIQIDLLQKLSSDLNGENVDKLFENLESDCPYIISKNDTYLFIDYLTKIPENDKMVTFYRIIVQDISQLNVEMSEIELKSLEDNLPELLSILNIDFKCGDNVPQRVIEEDKKNVENELEEKKEIENSPDSFVEEKESDNNQNIKVE